MEGTVFNIKSSSDVKSAKKKHAEATGTSINLKSKALEKVVKAKKTTTTKLNF